MALSNTSRQNFCVSLANKNDGEHVHNIMAQVSAADTTTAPAFAYGLSITTGGQTITSGSLTLTSGNLVLTSGNATLTSGNLTLTSGNAVLTAGNFTMSAGIVSITPTAATSTTVDIVGASLTTGKGIDLSDLNALTTGIGVHLASSATAIATTGRLLYSNHTGATSTSGVLNEFASAATDETVILKVTASAALALGVAMNVSVAAMTTGIALSIADADALTTGNICKFYSNSSDASARTLVDIKNDHASAVGTIPLKITQDGPTSTNFFKIAQFNSNALWMGNGNTANAALTGTAGDIIFNAGSNKPEYCTGTTNWTALV